MAYFRCVGGDGKVYKTSLVLPSNPVVEVRNNDNEVILTWSKPSSEVPIAKYQVYLQNTNPKDLTTMTFLGETTNLTYTVSNLEGENTYYFVVTSVTEDGYENASIKNKISYKIVKSAYLLWGNGKAFASRDLITWTEVTKRMGSFTKVAYSESYGMFYTDGDVHVSYNGYDWIDTQFPTIGVTSTSSTNKPTNIGVLRHYEQPIFSVGTMGGTNILYLNSDLSYRNWFQDRAFPSDPEYGYYMIMGAIYSADIQNGIFCTTDYYGSQETLSGVRRSKSDCICSGYRGRVYIYGCSDYGTNGYVYRKNVYENDKFKLCHTFSISTGSDEPYGMAVKSTKSDKDANDIILISTTAYAIYSKDGGLNWSTLYRADYDSQYTNDAVKINQAILSYDSVYDRFIAIKNKKIYTCPASKIEVMSSWEILGTTDGNLSNISGYVYLIAKQEVK